MASISYTAADVRPLPGAVTIRLDAASTCTPGDLVYVDSSGDAELADADGDASSRAVGIICAGPDGKASFSAADALDVVVFGPVAGFSSLTPGSFYYAATTAGDIDTAAPSGSSSDYLHIVGWSVSAATVFVQPWTYDIAAQ